MTPNDKLYMAAWLWHWYLNDAYDVIPVPGALRKSVKLIFPYKGTSTAVSYQSTARTIHNRLQSYPPKVNYE